MSRFWKTASRTAPRQPARCLLALEQLEDRSMPSQFGAWDIPVDLGPVINTEYSDQHPAISKDGLSLYITTNRPGGSGGDDIWVSQRASVGDPWGAPVNVGPMVNTVANDRVPTFSRDGHWMFFGSTRTGGLGGLDIWASYREDVHDDFAWQPAVNLGAGVNSPSNDDGPTFFQDEATGVVTLYFTSLNRPGNIGDWDIYASTQQPDGSFGPAVIVPELSSTGRDTRTAIRHDGREIFITSNRAGGQGGLDIWVSSRNSTADPWGTPVNLGSVVNSAADEGAPALSSDGQTLFFYSNRSGSVIDPVTGRPSNDLYMTTRSKHDNGDDSARQAAVRTAFTVLVELPDASAEQRIGYDPASKHDDGDAAAGPAAVRTALTDLVELPDVLQGTHSRIQQARFG
jgi:WD40-like Beta Propeller Repeat